jgi:hypothetical protein
VDAETSLEDLLKSTKLTQAASALNQYGVGDVPDIRKMAARDIEALQLKPLQQKRMMVEWCALNGKKKKVIMAPAKDSASIQPKKKSQLPQPSAELGRAMEEAAGQRAAPAPAPAPVSIHQQFSEVGSR